MEYGLTAARTEAPRNANAVEWAASVATASDNLWQQGAPSFRGGAQRRARNPYALSGRWSAESVPFINTGDMDSGLASFARAPE